jgi:catechol 2,3-dioxygenase-like lactoylglutathione lyase family enzyme
VKVRRIDHVVLTVTDIERTIAFYERVLGMTAISFAGGRRALAFGDQKLNLHQAGREFEPKARSPLPGAIDICLTTDVPLADVAAHLRKCSVDIELGPVDKIGARRPLRSLYFRDPDGNLIEVSNEVGL